MVTIKKIGPKGHEEISVSTKEATEMVEAVKGRYLVVDMATNKILNEIKIEENQRLMLVPVIKGG